MRQRSADELLGDLRKRGARRLERVTLRANRSTIWSLTQEGRALNLHQAYAGASAEVLDAFALIASHRGRDNLPVKEARRVVREWPVLIEALEGLQAERDQRRLIDGDDDGGQATHCCATAEQRQYLRAIYRYFNHTRFAGRLPDRIPIRLSNRMKSALGHMLPGVRGDSERYVVEIALNVDLMLAGNGAERVDTLLHEMAHAADYLVDGNRGHGSTWKQWARRARCRPDRLYHRPVQRRHRRDTTVTRVPPLPPALRQWKAA